MSNNVKAGIPKSGVSVPYSSIPKTEINYIIFRNASKKFFLSARNFMCSDAFKRRDTSENAGAMKPQSAEIEK